MVCNIDINCVFYIKYELIVGNKREQFLNKLSRKTLVDEFILGYCAKPHCYKEWEIMDGVLKISFIFTPIIDNTIFT